MINVKPPCLYNNAQTTLEFSHSNILQKTNSIFATLSPSVLALQEPYSTGCRLFLHTIAHIKKNLIPLFGNFGQSTFNAGLNTINK